MKKRITALILAGLIVAASGCAPLVNTVSYNPGGNDTYAGFSESDSGTSTDDSASSGKTETSAASVSSLFGKSTYGTKWVDSEVIGRVKATDEIRLQDDFAAAVNQEWIVSSDETAMVFQEVEDAVFDKEIAILEKISDMEGKNAQEFNKYHDLATDWDTRNAQGVGPLQAYLQEIDSISSRDELYAWITDPEKNPLGTAPVMYTTNARSEDDPSKVVCKLDIPDRFLGSDNFYYNASTIDSIDMKMLKEQELYIILDALGYSEKQQKQLLTSNYRMEKKLMSAKTQVTVDVVDPFIMSKEDAVKLAGSYPLEEYLSAFGITGDISVAADKKILKKLDRLCSGANLEKVKAFLKVQYIKVNYYNLDRNLYDQLSELTTKFNGGSTEEDSDMDPERMENMIFFQRYLATSAMSAVFNELYLEEYVSDEQQQRLEELVQTLIDSYREVILNEDWISDEGKELAVEKLDCVVPHVVSPNSEMINYDDLNLVSKQDGGSFLEAQLQLNYFARCRMAEDLYREYDKTVWNPVIGVNTLGTNAFYTGQENAIYILAGICEYPFYYEGISDEELLGTLGVIVGHELTHGFDQNGIQFDKDGIRKEWFPSADKMAFNDRVMKLTAFYTGLRPFNQTPYNGGKVSAEATADMGGMRITLNIAAKDPDFDYEKYFRAEATMWRARYSEKVEKSYFENDNHPLAYLRANVTVMQFEEFVETFNVQPGDGMYLEPEKRIAIW